MLEALCSELKPKLLQIDAAKPFHTNTWRFSEEARIMVFFYHDPHNQRLRTHTLRDYLPSHPWWLTGREGTGSTLVPLAAGMSPRRTKRGQVRSALLFCGTAAGLSH